jgi:hypothetical protein
MEGLLLVPGYSEKSETHLRENAKLAKKKEIENQAASRFDNVEDL